MLTPILGLRTTICKVADIEKAKAWYAGAFAATPTFEEPFYVGFNIAGYELGLMPDHTPADAKTANVLCYWGVEDIGGAVARFIELGVFIRPSRRVNCSAFALIRVKSFGG